jgi:uncharacterized membrane protein YhaH (DUF805 family)
MTFGEANATFFRKYVDFSGRARRSEYWWVVLFLLVVSVPVAVVDTVLFVDIVLEMGIGPSSLLLAVGVLLPGISLAVRRFHDVGLSGWFVLLTLIPIAGGVFALIVALLDSQPGINRFGPSSKYREGYALPVGHPEKESSS